MYVYKQEYSMLCTVYLRRVQKEGKRRPLWEKIQLRFNETETERLRHKRLLREREEHTQWLPVLREKEQRAENKMEG